MVVQTAVCMGLLLHGSFGSNAPLEGHLPSWSLPETRVCSGSTHANYLGIRDCPFPTFFLLKQINRSQLCASSSSTEVCSALGMRRGATCSFGESLYHLYRPFPVTLNLSSGGCSSTSVPHSSSWRLCGWGHTGRTGSLPSAPSTSSSVHGVKAVLL